MSISQTQIRDHNVATVAAAALVGRPDEIAYVAALNAHFYYAIDAAAVADGTTILTALGTNAVWKIVGSVAVQNNFTATTAPTATDDSAAGYAVGSMWVDVTANISYVCVDATATAAIWVKTTADVLNNFMATVPPSATTDNTAGYAVGSMWYDTVADDLYVAVTVATAAASWMRVSNDTQNNFVAVTNPSATDDSSVGYSNGSLWVNLSTHEGFICTDNTATAAIWKSTTQNSVPASSFNVINIAATTTAGTSITTPIALGATATAFNGNEVVVQLNGFEQLKGTDVTWLTATTFSLATNTYAGDVVVVKP